MSDSVVRLPAQQRPGRFALLGCLAVQPLLFAPACTPRHASKRITSPTLAENQPRDLPGLHNIVAYHDDFLSGSAPDGDHAFDTLARMGIRTIISVDGALPNVAAARARGLRYIHLPIGYNGFDETRRLELVRAARDALQQGPVYIHCHHGKHRSAGAAAAIAVSLGCLTRDEAVARMKVSGTSPAYRGLYACAAAAVLSVAAVNAVPADFPEISPPPGFIRAMLEIDEANDHLKAIEKAGWKTPADHPDLVPAAEAGRLADLFRHLAAGDRTAAEPPDFAARLNADADRAQVIETALASGNPDPSRLSAQFKQIAKSCTDCHAAHRD